MGYPLDVQFAGVGRLQGCEEVGRFGNVLGRSVVPRWTQQRCLARFPPWFLDGGDGEVLGLLQALSIGSLYERAYDHPDVNERDQGAENNFLGAALGRHWSWMSPWNLALNIKHWVDINYYFQKYQNGYMGRSWGHYTWPSIGAMLQFMGSLG
jgi:hypothetical protein